MKIYTKTGDKGLTSLIGGVRILKSEDRINAYGTVDELNSHMGLLRDQDVNKKRKDILKEIQDRLFTIGSILASGPEKSKMKIPDLQETDIKLLEDTIDEMESSLEPLKEFVLPGGHQSVSFCHIARCVCRRAERLIVSLQQKEPVHELIVVYLNRLSDYLFVLSRIMCKELNAEEVIWKPRI